MKEKIKAVVVNRAAPFVKNKLGPFILWAAKEAIEGYVAVRVKEELRKASK